VLNSVWAFLWLKKLYFELFEEIAEQIKNKLAIDFVKMVEAENEGIRE